MRYLLRKYGPLIFALFYCLNPVISQSDSLIALLTKFSDTSKTSHYQKIIESLLKEGKVDAANNYLTECEKHISKHFNQKQWLRFRLVRINVLYRKSQFKQSLDSATVLLKDPNTQNDFKIIADCQNYIGMNSGRLGKFSDALKWYHKAIENYEKIKQEKGITRVTVNIAGIYFDQGDYKTAITYFEKALSDNIRYQDNRQIGLMYNNIGSAYHNLLNYPKAVEYYLKSAEINKAGGFLNSLAYNYTNLSYCEQEAGNLPAALKYNQECIKIFEQENDAYSLPGAYLQYAQLLGIAKKFSHALFYATKAIKIAESTGSPLLRQRSYESASRIYESAGNSKAALVYLKKFLAVKDSIINEDIRNEVTKNQIQFEFDKKRLADSIQQKAREAILHQEIENKEKQSALQRNLLISLSGIIILLIGLALVIFRFFKQSKKDKEIIAQQKADVERQKDVVEIKNKEILDSIFYAKNIQDAILPAPQSIAEIFPDYFIFFKPRDIVSGDFYWTTAVNGYAFAVAADCTGHGVPGAFMSMLGVSLLNEIILEQKILEPEVILDNMRQRVSTALHQQQQNSRSMDGMDIAIIRYYKETGELVVASAQSKVLVVSNKFPNLIKGDNQSVGKNFTVTTNFKRYKLKLKPGDMIYMMSDGYGDQFGGPKGKKFKSKQLLHLLYSNAHLSTKEQFLILEKNFLQWKNNLEQVDDVLVLGIKI